MTVVFLLKTRSGTGNCSEEWEKFKSEFKTEVLSLLTKDRGVICLQMDVLVILVSAFIVVLSLTVIFILVATPCLDSCKTCCRVEIEFEDADNPYCDVR